MNTDDRALADLIAVVRKRYTAEPVPPCPVCGEPLSLQAAGRGTITWGCTKRDAGKSRLDDHYARSRFEQHRTGDDDVLALLDRLEAFHAKPGRDDIERDVRIAIWNAAMKGGMGQDLSQAFIVRAMAEPMMVRALAGLQSPPPVVSDLSPPTQRMEKILDAPFLRRSPPVVSGEASWHDDRQTREEIVDEAISGLKADLAELAPVVEEGRREAAAKAFLAVHYDWQGDPELW